jgi:hypothetical protein
MGQHPPVPKDDLWELVGEAEHIADGTITDQEWHPAWHRFATAASRVADGMVARCLIAPTHNLRFWMSAKMFTAPAGVSTCFHEVFGNPFRPATMASQWSTGAVNALACQMYELGDFSVMPILADALQIVGCDSDDILDHCRGPGPHVRGCWVVDLVLAKE